MVEEEGRRAMERRRKRMEGGRGGERMKEGRVEEVEVEGEGAGGGAEFIKNNIKNGRETTDKERSRATSRELNRLREKEDEEKKNPLHDSSYRSPQTVGVVKAG